MLVTVNGHPRELPGSCTVDEAIRSLGLDPTYVIVEHNAEALERKRYGAVLLSEGDHLELVRAVAGG